MTTRCAANLLRLPIMTYHIDTASCYFQPHCYCDSLSTVAVTSSNNMACCEQEEASCSMTSNSEASTVDKQSIGCVRCCTNQSAQFIRNMCNSLMIARHLELPNTYTSTCKPASQPSHSGESRVSDLQI